jgi:hypothetical protein
VQGLPHYESNPDNAGANGSLKVHTAPFVSSN